MLAYPWPGNVRELRHVIERVCIMHDGEMLEPAHLPRELTEQLTEPLDAAMSHALVSDSPSPLKASTWTKW